MFIHLTLVLKHVPLKFGIFWSMIFIVFSIGPFIFIYTYDCCLGIFIFYDHYLHLLFNVFLYKSYISDMQQSL